MLIFVHELGHFISAKKAGCQVDEFGFGFPPRLFGIKRGETTYTLNAIPLGGFVKILGEDGEGQDNPRSFSSKPIWQRIIVLVSGVVMNFILAFVLLSIGFAIGLPSVITDENVSRAHDIKVQISSVVEGTPADQAQIKPGDTIHSINGVDITDSETLQEMVGNNKGSEISVELERIDERLTVSLIPRADFPEGEGPLGVALVQTGTVSYPIHLALWNGLTATLFMSIEIVRVFSGIVRDLFTTGNVTGDVAGPVGIAVLTGQAARMGFVYLLQFTALLSINLGVINVLPLPALDGGRVLFAVIEKIRNKKINKNVEGMVHLIGFSVFLLLMLFVTARDVSRFRDSFSRLWERITSVF